MRNKLRGASRRSPVTLNGGVAGVKGLLYAARAVSLPSRDTFRYVAHAPLKLGWLLCLLSILSACGSTPAAPAAPTAPAQSRISFMISGDPLEKAAYEHLVRAFGERHPEIAVELIHIPSASDYRKRLGADLVVGKPADIVLLNYRRYATYAARNQFEPLGPYLDTSTLLKRDAFFPEALDAFSWQGTLTCLPQNMSSLVVYYNKTLFAQAGLPEPSDTWNWDEFVQTAKALTKDTNSDGTIDQYGLGTEPTLIRAAPFIWQAGGEILDAEGHGLALDTPEARRALQWFIDLRLVHGVVPDAVQEQAQDSESRFLNGTLAMFLNSRRGVTTYRDITSFDWDVAPLPRGEQAASVLHADGYCLTAASSQKQAAWTFIEFANSAEGQTIIASTGRTVPSLQEIARSPAFLDPNAKPARSQVFLDAIQQTRPVPVMETWQDIEEIVDDELRRAFYGEASLEEVLASVRTRTEEFFPQR